MPSQGYMQIVRNETDKAPKLLAKTFVKELLQSGYTEAQIILIAAEILACLNKDLVTEKRDCKIADGLVSIAT